MYSFTRHTLTALLVLSALALAAPAAAMGGKTAAMTARRDKAAVRLFSKFFAQLFNLNNAKLQPTIFVPRGRRILLGETQATGRPAIERALTAFFGAVRSRKLTRFTRSVRRVGRFGRNGRLYRETGTYTLVSVLKNGKTVRETGRVWTFWTVETRKMPRVVRIVVRRGV